MTGALRLTLAVLVVVSHLADAPGLSYLGYYAVRTFFVLSGFAITGALNDVYGLDKSRFWANRFLRLMPIYLMVCLGTTLAIRLLPLEAAAFLPRWGFDLTLTAVLQNLMLLPLTLAPPDLRLIVPAWSVAVEIVMYLLLYLGMGRSQRGAILCLGVGVAYNCFLLAVNAPFESRYFSLGSSLFSFSLGALAHFWLKRHAFRARTGHVLLALGLWGGNIAAAGFSTPENYQLYAGYYLNAVLAALVVSSLCSFKLGPLARKFDLIAGHLSYPVFLSHWLAAFCVHVFLMPGTSRGWVFLLAATPFILGFSAVLAWFQQRLVEPMRNGIRAAPPANPPVDALPSARMSAG